MKLFSKIKSGLTKSATSISSGITSIFTKHRLDAETLSKLEDLLIMSDIGVATSSKIIKGLKTQRMGKEISDVEIKEILAEEINLILSPCASSLDFKSDKKPLCLMFVGVNGTGKTTSLGKIAAKYQKEGKKVVIAACDTFRAAAVEQLQKWSERSGAIFFSGKENQDPASVSFQAYEEARKQNADVILIDTAGRLQNKKQLMEELAKISRVLQKHDDALPHQIILVLDATTGQNAISQAEIFTEVAKVNGLIVTKLDGSAKGGVVVALADKFKLPIHAIGVGEAIEDLEDFNSLEFSKGLVGV